MQVTDLHPTRGRQLHTWSHSRDIANTLFGYRSALSASHRLDAGAELTPESLLGNWPECISFSNLDDASAQAVVEMAAATGMLIAALSWDPLEPQAVNVFWSRLLLTRIISQGTILADYEEIPLNDFIDEANLRWRPDRSPHPPVEGFFFSDDIHSEVYPEVRYERLPIPRDLNISARPRPARSPLEQVIDRVGSEPVLRVGGMDDPTSPGEFRLPAPERQYPDVVSSEARVRSYCLDRSHPQRKWRGFEAHGWGSGPHDSVILAALFCSAMMGTFRPVDVQATADGAVQFGVYAALPSRRYVYMPTLSAWISEPGKPLRLTTAFVVGSGDAAHFAPSLEPADSMLDWTEVIAASVRFGRQVPPDPITRALPRLYIQRAGEANGLTKWLVRQNQSHGNFSRAPLGRTLLVPIGGEMSWSQACRTAAYGQVRLGLYGIRAKVGTWVD